MDEAPERIWATEDRENFGEDRFHATTPMRGLTEYVRADIAAATEAELRAEIATLRATVDAYRDGTLPDLTAVYMGARKDAGAEITRLRALLDEAREGLAVACPRALAELASHPFVLNEAERAEEALIRAKIDGKEPD